MTESTPTLTPERAAAIMRLWLPQGPFPGAPSTGPALLARSRQQSGPAAYIVPGPGRGSRRYVESEVIEYCRCLWPPQIRHALAVLARTEEMMDGYRQLEASTDAEKAVQAVLASALGWTDTAGALGTGQDVGDEPMSQDTTSTPDHRSEGLGSVVRRS